MDCARRFGRRRMIWTAHAAALVGLLAGAVQVFAAQAATSPQAPPKKSSSSPSKTQAPANKSATSKARRTSSRSRVQRAPTADRIREIQRALATSGQYSSEPTGKWDARTVEALKAFQQGNGLTPTGKLDARTLQKLGLGSEVAGSAPPRPAQGNPQANLSPRQ